MKFTRSHQDISTEAPTKMFFYSMARCFLVVGTFHWRNDNYSQFPQWFRKVRSAHTACVYVGEHERFWVSIFSGTVPSAPDSYPTACQTSQHGCFVEPFTHNTQSEHMWSSQENSSNFSFISHRPYMAINCLQSSSEVYLEADHLLWLWP